MSTVIIIGGSGRLRTAIDNINSTASQHNWTQAQKAAAAALLNKCADDVEQFTANPQPPA